MQLLEAGKVIFYVLKSFNFAEVQKLHYSVYGERMHLFHNSILNYIGTTSYFFFRSLTRVCGISLVEF